MPISEYIVKQKNEGAVLFKKIAAAFGYAILLAILQVLIFAFAPPLLYIPLLIMALAFVGVVVFVTWRFLCLEYEIVIGNGELCITVIYGRSITKRLISLPIASISEIGTYDDAAYKRLSSASLQKNYICISSLSAPEVFYAIYEDGKDRCVIYFETDERGISILKQQNPTAFRRSKQ